MGELSLPIDRFRVPRLDEMGDLPSRAYHITSREYAYPPLPAPLSLTPIVVNPLLGDFL